MLQQLNFVNRQGCAFKLVGVHGDNAMFFQDSSLNMPHFPVLTANEWSEIFIVHQQVFWNLVKPCEVS